jgi:hypothetical protein
MLGSLIRMFLFRSGKGGGMYAKLCIIMIAKYMHGCPGNICVYSCDSTVIFLSFLRWIASFRVVYITTLALSTQNTPFSTQIYFKFHTAMENNKPKYYCHHTSVCCLLSSLNIAMENNKHYYTYDRPNHFKFNARSSSVTI